MSLAIQSGAPTLFIRREAYERAGLVRANFDARFTLTDEEFRVSGNLVAIGPLYDADALAETIAELEETGLGYFDDFFEMTGNWPEWLSLYALPSRG